MLLLAAIVRVCCSNWKSDAQTGIYISGANLFFKSFLKNLAYLPLCCPVQMEGLVFRMYCHRIVRIDIYPCVKNSNNNNSEKNKTTLALACWDDRKEKGEVTRPLLFSTGSRSSPIPLVACSLFRSSSLTGSLEQATHTAVTSSRGDSTQRINEMGRERSSKRWSRVRTTSFV